MDGNVSDRTDARAMIGGMGRVATALTAAASDFWGRFWEIGTRRLVSALVDPLGAAAAQAACFGSAQGLFRQSGEWLAELALPAPLAVQTFQRHLAARPESRLLFCAAAEPGGSPKNFSAHSELSDVPPLDLLLPASRAGAQTLVDKLRNTLKELSSQYQVPPDKLAEFLVGLVRALSGPGTDIGHISRLLGEVGQAHANQQTSRVSTLWVALNEALERSGEHRPGPALELEEVLGATGASAMPLVRNPEILHRFFRAFGADAPYIAVDEPLRRQLREAFGGAGIELSDHVSIACGFRDWIIRDPATDREFHVVRAGQRLEVYGRSEGKAYRIGETRVQLPARVHDASQGCAIYSVPIEIVQDLLDLHQPRALRAWDVGSGRTPIAIFIVDYRDSDLGSYRELGIAGFAAPKRNPLAVGMNIFQLPVTDKFSCEAGRHIWGYPKSLYDLDFTYRDDSVTSALIKRGSPAQKLFTLTLPRAGSGSSRDVPLYTYTMKRGIQHRTIFTRSGRGEGIRWGGRTVRLEVHADMADAVLNTVLCLGLPARVPVFSSWTEHVSGEFGVPSVLTATA